MNMDDLHAVEALVSLRDVQKDIQNLRQAQTFCRSCPPEVRAFLEPTINLAADMILDICEDIDIDAEALEEASIETYTFNLTSRPRKRRREQEGPNT